MSVPTPLPPLTVTGGSHGVAATYERVRALADTFDVAGDRLRDQAALGGRVLANGDLLESSVLSPATFAVAEAAVLAATTGPDGLLVQSLAWETDAVLVRGTVSAFEATDALVHETFEVIDYTVGRSLGYLLSSSLVAAALTAPVWLPYVAAAGGTGFLVYQALPAPLQTQIRGVTAETAESVTAQVQGWLAEHPEVVEHLVNGSGGLVDGFWDGLTPGVPLGPFGISSFHPTTEDAAGLVAGFYPPDGEPQVTTRSDLTGAGAAPTSLHDLMAHLDTVSSWSDAHHPENNGTIEIQSWTDGAGTRHHIVYLPGTDDLTTLPWTMDGDVRDLPTNLLAISGHDTAYAQGVLQAMHQAGIGAHDPVLVAGHSQGGIEAAWLASHTHEFAIDQVVTAGSPIATIGDFPSGTQVLSFEHRGDVVPLLDGEANPDTTHHVTVTFDEHETALGANHDLSHYLHGAAAADASSDPSISDQITTMHAEGFLTGDQRGLQSQVFQITRRP